jgi:hypothetical protein
VACLEAAAAAATAAAAAAAAGSPAVDAPLAENADAAADDAAEAWLYDENENENFSH